MTSPGGTDDLSTAFSSHFEPFLPVYHLFHSFLGHTETRKTFRNGTHWCFLIDSKQSNRSERASSRALMNRSVARCAQLFLILQCLANQ